jgi:hypothetical protein
MLPLLLVHPLTSSSTATALDEEGSSNGTEQAARRAFGVSTQMREEACFALSLSLTRVCFLF